MCQEWIEIYYTLEFINMWIGGNYINIVSSIDELQLKFSFPKLVLPI